MSTTPGIDVSRWQGKINWKKVAAAGYRFAVIRATIGHHYTDSRFYVNWNGAQEAGLLISTYHVVKPSHPASSQIDRFLDVLGSRKADLPLVLDIELDDDLSPADITICIRDCLQKVEQQEGRKPIIYTGKWFWDAQVLPSSEWSKYDLWVANYGVSTPSLPTGWNRWRFWQYSETGSVPGINSSTTDLNWFAGNYEDLLAYAGGKQPQPQPKVKLQARITEPELKIRSGPGVNYEHIGDLHAGDVINVATLKGRDIWIEFEPGKWSAFAFREEQYMELM